MREPNVIVMRRATLLWIGAGLILGFNVFAASQARPSPIFWSLAFSLCGIAFGTWAARQVTARS